MRVWGQPLTVRQLKDVCEELIKDGYGDKIVVDSNNDDHPLIDLICEGEHWDSAILWWDPEEGPGEAS